MIHGDAAGRTLLILNILQKQSDAEHIISMPDLIAELAAKGIAADRRTIYQSLDALRRNGWDIRFTRRLGQGYYLNRPFQPAEIMILTDAVQNSPAITGDQADHLSERLKNLLSIRQQELLPAFSAAEEKTDNPNVIRYIEILLEAAAGRHPVEFRYYDVSVNRQKKYRRSRRSYHLLPCAVMSSQGRYYGVFFDRKYGDFAAYRIDKMEQLQMLEETEEPVYFDAEAWRRTSFDMYHGEAVTVTAVFDRSLSNALFDRFGQNIIISNVTDTDFTASIRTAVTPTLTAWFLQFYDRITILRPASLITALQDIAASIHSTYGERRIEHGSEKTGATSENHQ